MEVGWWALIVSGASLLVSAATFWRNRTPTPRWVAGVAIKGPDSDGEVRVTATATNRGRGDARDVKLEQEGGGILSLSAFSRETRERAEFGERMSVTLIYPADTTGEGSFRLTWSQEPNLHRERSRTLRFRLNGGGGELPSAKHDIGIY